MTCCTFGKKDNNSHFSRCKLKLSTQQCGKRAEISFNNSPPNESYNNQPKMVDFTQIREVTHMKLVNEEPSLLDRGVILSKWNIILC